ncbi:MAG: N-acetylmuramoyl-L-alanine amidase CwlH precursor [Smithella sp. PtaU1.Bin162]|nr:MAG: N-acetylmuramoyl-L-alanine amidase CwlH precursor [Smithella sp. PtaU1.Bin162]
MGKISAYILGGLVIIVMFSAPLRDYMNKLVHRDKKEMREEEIIGRTSGRNPRVEEIQNALKEAGFDPGPADGVMGSQTRTAIKGFQKKHGLKPTGQIDPATNLALNKTKEIEKPFNKEISDPDSFSKSDEQIQKALKNAGFYKGVIDGKVGPRTKSAIREFQKANGLNADGSVGDKTWQALKTYLKDE